MTLETRNLKFVLDMGGSGGTFANGSTERTVENVRASVDLDRAGQVTMSECHVRIFGLERQTMFDLTQLQGTLVSPNTLRIITVFAWSGDAQPQQIFQGPMYQAWADIQGGPDAPFVITAHEGMDAAQQSAPPTSVKGGGDAAVMLSNIANTMHWQFENKSGLSVQLSNHYEGGTPLAQAQAIAQAAGMAMTVQNGVLAIWKLNEARQVDPTAISAATGLVGYPSFTENGIALRVLFRNDLLLGAQMNVVSDITPACGPWNMFHINHQLESQTAGGKWFTDIEGSKLGTPQPISTPSQQSG